MILFPVVDLKSIDLQDLFMGSGIRITGERYGDRLGTSVAMGNVNGDGYKDVLIGAPSFQNSTGAAYLIFGKTALTDISLSTLSSTTGIRYTAPGVNYQLGRSVDIGDMNKDGYGDMAFGAPSYFSNTGIIYIVYGSASPSTLNLGSLAVLSGVTINGPDINYAAGFSLTMKFDSNMDGKIDPVISAPQFTSNQGRTYLVVSPPTNPLSMTSIAGDKYLSGEPGNSQSGYTVTSGGDVNGDGKFDFIIGAPAAGNGGKGYVLFGGNLWSTVSLQVLSANPSYGFVISSSISIPIGTSFSCSGDVNGDGVTDILIGSPSYSSNRGMAYVIFGKSGITNLALPTLTASDGFSITGFGSNSQTGAAVDIGGDFNKDGISDMVISATRYASNTGAVFVVYGRTNIGSVTIDLTTFPSTYGMAIYGEGVNCYTGFALNMDGDVNGDGYADLLIGAPGYNNNRGRVYVIFGASTSSEIFLTDPSGQPTSQPSIPSGQPTSQPSNPTGQPSSSPTNPTTQPSSQPSRQPISQPTGQPSRQPFSRPTGQPSRQPTSRPSLQPTGQPTSSPSLPTSFPTCAPTQPTSQPTSQPLATPTSQPSAQPSRAPSTQPSSRPSRQPTGQPSRQPFSKPTSQPTGQPTSQPSTQPSRQPTRQPTSQPSVQPSSKPTVSPSSQPTSSPTSQPSSRPTSQPSSQPTIQPTSQPSADPSGQPTAQPSRQPTSQPTCQPTTQPTNQPLSKPTGQPTMQPSLQPSAQPFSAPSSSPTRQPSSKPSNQPTIQPSSQPSRQPSVQPSSQPSLQPTNQPSTQPTLQPSVIPTRQPTSQPSRLPSLQPSSRPTVQPSAQPSFQPSGQPTMQPLCCPTGQPSMQPTKSPTTQPTSTPSADPSGYPSSQPTLVPTGQPSKFPTTQPTTAPSMQPTSFPTIEPSAIPSSQPTSLPSTIPSAIPSNSPTTSPTRAPSDQPTALPTCQPTSLPSGLPSNQPSSEPTTIPTSQPSDRPSSCPSAQPSNKPTLTPSSHPTRGPSGQPTAFPSSLPSSVPSTQPSTLPTIIPTTLPTGVPSSLPSMTPSSLPSPFPTTVPSVSPSSSPSNLPTSIPSSQPVPRPSSQPSSYPTEVPSAYPTDAPTTIPTKQPVSVPSTIPSCSPSHFPSSRPTIQPSQSPSTQPSSKPSDQPSSRPSHRPTYQPFSHPSAQPSSRPSTKPSFSPSVYSRSPSFSPSQSGPTVPVPTRSPTAVPSCSPTSTISIYPSAFNTNFQISLFLLGSSSILSSSVLTDVYLPSFPSSSLGRSYLILGRKSRFQNLSSLSLIEATIQDDDFVVVHDSFRDHVMLLEQNVNNIDGGIYPTENGQTRSVTIIGDINKDGSPDLLFGDPLNSRAFVYFGNEEGANVFSNLRVSFMITINPESATVKTGLGWAAASLGDFNRDGYDDFIVTAPTVNQAYVVYGRRTKRFLNHLTLTEMQSSSQGFRIQGNSVVDRAFGMAVSGAGDVNGDGYADILISALTASSSSQANVYIVFGNSSSMSTLIDLSNPAIVSQRIVKISTPKSSFSGLSITGIGDFDGDGYDDVAIGSAPYQSGQSVDQRTFIVFGRGDFLRRKREVNVLDAEDAVTIEGGGFMVTRVGDVNGDGLDDLMISSYTGWLGKSNAYCILQPRNITFPASTFQPITSPTNHPTLFPITSSPSLVGSGVPSTPFHQQTIVPTILSTKRSSVLPCISSNLPTRKASSHPSSQNPSRSPTVSPSRKPFVSPTIRPTILHHPTSFPSSYPTNKIVVPIYEIYINTTGEYVPPSPWTTADDDGIQLRQTNLILEVPASGSLLIGVASNRMIYTILPSVSIITITTFRNNYDLLNLTAFASIHSLDDLQYTNVSSTLALLLPAAAAASSTTFSTISIQQRVILLSHQSFDLMAESIVFASVVDDNQSSHNDSNGQLAITSSTAYLSALVALIILLLVLTIGFIWFAVKYCKIGSDMKSKTLKKMSSERNQPNNNHADDALDLESRGLLRVTSAVSRKQCSSLAQEDPFLIIRQLPLPRKISLVDVVDQDLAVCKVNLQKDQKDTFSNGNDSDDENMNINEDENDCDDEDDSWNFSSLLSLSEEDESTITSPVHEHSEPTQTNAIDSIHESRLQNSNLSSSSASSYDSSSGSIYNHSK